MSQIKLPLKKNRINLQKKGGRYEEYIWINKNCFSIFKDGHKKYTVSVNSSSSTERSFALKKDALKELTKRIIKEIQE